MNFIHSDAVINGDLIIGFFVLFLDSHNAQGWYYLEDLLFGDLGMFNMMLIPLLYMPYVVTVVVLYFM